MRALFAPEEREFFYIFPYIQSLFVALLIYRGPPRRHAFQQLRLCGDVIFVGAVPVDMVRREVRDDADVADEILRPVKLEARQFEHDEIIKLINGLRYRVADIASGHHGISHPLKVIADHRRSGRLSVASRDAYHYAVEVRRNEVELSRYLYPLFARLGENRDVRRKARADYDLVGLERPFAVFALLPLDILFAEIFDDLGSYLIFIRHEDLGAELGRELGERAAAHAGPYHADSSAAQFFIFLHAHQQLSDLKVNVV